MGRHQVRGNDRPVARHNLRTSIRVMTDNTNALLLRMRDKPSTQWDETKIRNKLELAQALFEECLEII